jgi:hypothetical protein
MLMVKGSKKIMLLEAMEPDLKWEYETDIVVVGYGGGQEQQRQLRLTITELPY